ncbi:thiamine ABC transporter substrate-binding protein [Nocardioides sp. dk4132]|uniref:thiamine ABC transporter substrate-binding protein n=1 Tax=unclassified Nocardioides TaxID=2615069 RepID=UPI001296BFC5|nr:MULTISPECIES: thiamine ABC transporter substrate-binding protein [unclassified Nocardioides]MQW74407.1 thiamine ABC transporter substrate-binding protein [Nocardioides sp. dk4132]QGA06349.1 thiamine ABC transporter substrate-binding protein [Nocardioides sp. dk884]
MVLSTHARSAVLTGLAVLATSVLGGCSLTGSSGEEAAEGSDRVVLVTHDSFALPDELVADFEERTGLDLEVRPSGDAGTLTNKLVLSKDDPVGDVAFGVDNTFASRALAEGVFASYAPGLPAGVAAHELPGDDEDLLTPVDTGAVCLNVDDTWYAERDLTPPRTLEDLTDPAYRDQLVLPGATTSSPGMAFLLTTIARYGEEWPDYWRELMDNGARLTNGWSDAYQGEFTQGGGAGDRPLVLSYDSSPAFTVSSGTSTTSALLDTCFEQVEYAGVLAGADNPEGAEQVIDFLLSDEVQAALPESMYVFPVSGQVELPAAWAKHAPRPERTWQVDPAAIDENRAEWLREWNDLVAR